MQPDRNAILGIYLYPSPPPQFSTISRLITSSHEGLPGQAKILRRTHFAITASLRRCCRKAVEVTPISTKAMYQVTRIERGFPTLIMRFSALTAIATSPC
jgi:hypothetical protein